MGKREGTVQSLPDDTETYSQQDSFYEASWTIRVDQMDVSGS